MRVYFVGIHNKPGLTPLCGSTRTGKIIDKVIQSISQESVKTNLCDIEEFPHPDDVAIHAGEWWVRHQPGDDDVIVLLGQFVHNNFRKRIGRIVKLPHPAGVYGTMKREDWIHRAVESIALSSLTSRG